MFSFNAPISSEGGHTSFQNNIPDPDTSGDELPTFKFEVEKSTGRVIDGSYGKEATVKQLPISKALAGVSMLLQPGVMRELHWHEHRVLKLAIGNARRERSLTAAEAAELFIISVQTTWPRW